MLSYDNSANEIKKSDVDTVILPIGSIEQHGPHLPIGVDYFAVEAIAKGVAKNINALLYPVIPFSTCYEHKGSKGSLCMRPETFYHMLQDLVLNLREQGFKKVIIMIWHGGVYIAAPAVRELNALYDDLQVVLIHGIVPKEIERIVETPNELHAGELETSITLYLKEETVNKEEMMKHDFIPDCPRDFLNYAPILNICPDGVWGKPSKASYQKGKLIYECMVKGYTDYINQAFAVVANEKW